MTRPRAHGRCVLKIKLSLYYITPQLSSDRAKQTCLRCKYRYYFPDIFIIAPESLVESPFSLSERLFFSLYFFLSFLYFHSSIFFLFLYIQNLNVTSRLINLSLDFDIHVDSKHRYKNIEYIFLKKKIFYNYCYMYSCRYVVFL